MCEFFIGVMLKLDVVGISVTKVSFMNHTAIQIRFNLFNIRDIDEKLIEKNKSG